jgi:hypothetical protein
VRSVAADLDIPPEQAWHLYSHPGEWASWAPHMRGASGLTGYNGEVRAGARGIVWLLGFAPIPVKVTWVDKGHSWSWRLGPIDIDHVVEPNEHGGCRVAMVIHGPSVLEDVAAAVYGAPAQFFLRNMGRVGRLSAPANRR